MPSFTYTSRLIITLLVLFLLMSCNNDNSRAIIEDLQIPSDTFPNSNTQSRSILISLFDREMSQSDVISWSDGYTGNESRQSFRFKWFSNWATTEELLVLINSKNPTTKVYSFLALNERKGVNIKPIVLRHLRDTTAFVEKYGCLAHSERINSYFLEKAFDKFMPTEGVYYRNIIAQVNSKFEKQLFPN